MQPARVRLLRALSGYKHATPTSSPSRARPGCGDSFTTSPDPAARVLVPETCYVYLNTAACNSWPNSCHRRTALATGTGTPPYRSHRAPTCPRISPPPPPPFHSLPPPHHRLLLLLPSPFGLHASTDSGRGGRTGIREYTFSHC